MALKSAAATFLAAGCCWNAAAPICVAANAGLLRTVATTGQAAPGTSGGAFGTFSQPPSFNESGQAAFLATLQTFGTVVTFDSDSGIWSEGRGALALVAREGNPAPGTPSGVLFGSSLGTPAINDQGQTGFLSSLRGTVNTNTDGAAWSEVTGVLAPVAREGELAPGAGVSFSATSRDGCDQRTRPDGVRRRLADQRRCDCF